jgi:hypothetical protein
MTDTNWIAKSIIPKSDQLNAEDLLSGPITVTVQDVRQGSAEQPIAIVIDGGRQPYKPCKTMRKVLVYCWGDQAANWIGKRMTLYADPEVKWAGVAVGGIRISHLSGIESKVVLMLSETKGKRKAIAVQPLPDANSAKPTQPDVPPEIAAVLNEWRPRLTSTDKALVAMAKRIAAVRGVEQAMLVEEDLSSMEDHDARILLTDFLTAMLAALT